MTRRRYEISTVGANEANQGLTTDPFLPSTNPTSLGLRIPPVLPGISHDLQPRYLFLLARRVLGTGRTRLLGIRQGLTLGCNVASAGTNLFAEEFLVTSPYWHFVDGNVSWHVIIEPNQEEVMTRPTTDAPSFAFGDCTDPAMLYAKGTTFTAGSTDPNTGAPYYYDIGLKTYVAPQRQGQWLPVAGLGNMKDIRFPWNEATNALAIDAPIEGSYKISLYASVLQSDPATRAAPTIPSLTYQNGIARETAFVENFATDETPSPVIYWRIFGSLLFEDEI